MPLVAVVLFFVFGGVIAAGLPAIVGGLTIAGVARHHAAGRRVRARALLRPARGDADGPRHRDRLRPVHGEPVP